MNRLDRSDSPWNEVYSWFWINEQEIYNATQEEFEKRAKQLKEDGATIVVDFSLTHYRLSFMPYMNKIHDTISKLAAACHKYGLKLVEHHSASLVFNLLKSDGWKRLEADIGSFSDWKSNVESWIKVPQYLICDPEIDGISLSSMYQIDGRTGKPADSAYSSDCLCYNNLNYRKVYFRYMTDLIQTGIDGIMNDDVQYFGDGNACTCEHCRRIFKEKYGYDLPQPDHWDEFYGDYSNSIYIAWERFKRESTTEFYHALSDLYNSLGVKMIRPNYVSALLEHNATSYGFDTCCDIWDNIFQENCFSTVIKASYVDYMAEAVHRFAEGRRNGVPSMSFFYPNRADTIYFSWALARSWGQLYTGTCEGQNISSLERKYREFEKEHERFYEAPRKLSDLFFYFSKKTRDYTKNAALKYMRPVMAGIQASCMSGLGTDMVFENDSFEDWKKCQCIVASHVAMASDAEIKRFAEYVHAGGKLIILGDFAIFDETNQSRLRDEITKAMGFDLKMVDYNFEGSEQVTYHNRSITLESIKAKFAFEAKDADVICSHNGHALAISKKIGDGEIIWAPFEINCNEYQPSVWADRRQVQPLPEKAYPSLINTQRKNTGALLHLFIGHPNIRVECLQDELYVSAFEVPNGLAAHLVNLSDTIPQDDCLIGHDEIIKNFNPDGKVMPEIKIQLLKPWKKSISRVEAYTPERGQSITPLFKDGDDTVTISMPEGFFTGYALVEITAF